MSPMDGMEKYCYDAMLKRQCWKQKEILKETEVLFKASDAKSLFCLFLIRLAFSKRKVVDYDGQLILKYGKNNEKWPNRERNAPCLPTLLIPMPGQNGFPAKCDGQILTWLDDHPVKFMFPLFTLRRKRLEKHLKQSWLLEKWRNVFSMRLDKRWICFQTFHT